MMSKSKSSLKRGLRVLYLLPLVCLGLSLQAQTVFVPADKGSVKVRVAQEGAEPLCILRQASGEEKVVSRAELSAVDPATIDSMEVLKDADSIAKYGDKGKNGVVIVKLKGAGSLNADLLFIVRQPWGEEKEVSRAEFEKIDPSRINAMEVLKDADAKAKYGDKAKNGVVIVSFKSPRELEEVVVVSYREKEDEPIAFRLMPDKMPGFQGGDQNAFSMWLCRQITVPADCNHSGTMKVSFEVYANGTVGDVRIDKGVCPELDALVKDTILKSPKWEPGTAKGKAIDTRLSIPVIFQVRPAPKK